MIAMDLLDSVRERCEKNIMRHQQIKARLYETAIITEGGLCRCGDCALWRDVLQVISTPGKGVPSLPPAAGRQEIP